MECIEALSNLPFGMRTARQDKDLPNLYRRLIGNLARSLVPGGRAALFTTQSTVIANALQPESRRLSIVETRAILAGGLPVQLWLLAVPR